MIPRGLPGKEISFVFDNGGYGGYGNPNPGSPTGNNNALRDYTRVLEFNRVTLEIVWQYTPLEAGFCFSRMHRSFTVPILASPRDFQNGNTLITEGPDGHLLEVTPEHEIVWEYINPYFHKIAGNSLTI